MTDAKLNKNNIFNTLATLTNFLFPLITFPYVTRVLGVENIGKFNFSNSVVSYFGLIATLGISSYAVRECAKLKDDRKKMSEIASDIYSIDIYSTIIAYILLFIALFVSVKLKNYNAYILLLSSQFLINTIGTTWICNAVEDFKFLSIRTILMHIFCLVGLFLFVRDKDDLNIYIILNVLANAGVNLFNIFYRKKYVDIRFKVFPDIKRHLKKIVLMFSQTVSMLLYTNADMIMLGYYYNDEAVGIYAIAVRVYNIVNMVISSVIGVATPGLSYDYDKRDYASFNDKLTYVVNYILFLFLPAFVGLNMMAPEIIRLVSGKDLLLAATALHILTISMLFSLISATLGLAILFPMGYDRINFNSCIISAVTNIVLNLYFIPKFGIAGAAITTAIAEFVGFLNKIKYIDKNIKVIGFSKMLAKYAVGSLLVLTICILLKHTIDTSNIRILVAMAACGVAYALYLLIIKDKFFIDFLSPILLKLKKEIKC